MLWLIQSCVNEEQFLSIYDLLKGHIGWLDIDILWGPNRWESSVVLRQRWLSWLQRSRRDTQKGEAKLSCTAKKDILSSDFFTISRWVNHRMGKVRARTRRSHHISLSGGGIGECEEGKSRNNVDMRPCAAFTSMRRAKNLVGRGTHGLFSYLIDYEMSFQRK